MKIAMVMLGVGLGLGFLAARATGSDAKAPAAAARESATGIGGVFFKARDPKALSAWYREHLGLEAQDGGAMQFLVFRWRERADAEQVGSTVWALFPQDAKHFAPSAAPFMVNYRVRNLERLLAQLRAGGVTVDGRIVDDFNGRFAWVMDPEGNKVELWEPKAGF